MERQGHPKCQRDTTRPCKVPRTPKKHKQTARGRVLAEGDVDPAAGSRDEPTRLPVAAPVAERKQRIEVQDTRALFCYSNNWVQALAPTFYRDPPLPTLRQPFFVLSHMEAQRVKTRGPNPNPTAQAQSKRSLPLSTKTQNIIDSVSILASILGAFFEHFPQKWHGGSRATPQSAHKTPTWTPRVPKWSPRVPK